MHGWLGRTLSEEQSLLGVTPGYAHIAQMFGLCALAAPSAVDLSPKDA